MPSLFPTDSAGSSLTPSFQLCMLAHDASDSIFLLTTWLHVQEEFRHRILPSIQWNLFHLLCKCKTFLDCDLYHLPPQQTPQSTWMETSLKTFYSCADNQTGPVSSLTPFMWQESVGVGNRGVAQMKYIPSFKSVIPKQDWLMCASLIFLVSQFRYFYAMPDTGYAGKKKPFSFKNNSPIGNINI